MPSSISPRPSNASPTSSASGNSLFVVPPDELQPPAAAPPDDLTLVLPPSRRGSGGLVGGGRGVSGPVPPPGAPPVLTPHGGAILKDASFVPIYLGDYWASPQGQSDRQAEDGFAQEFGSSKMQGVVAQYGAGPAGFGGSAQVPGTAPQTFTDADAQALVQKELASGAVKPNPLGIYTVFLPPGTVLDGGGGVTSLKGLGGFHGSYQGPDGKPVYYAVIVYSHGNNGVDFDGSPQDALAITSSHEWTEAETDPDVNSPIPGRALAWYDDADNAEIGDLAVAQLPLAQTFQVDDAGHTEQVEWSNLDGLYETAPQGSPGSEVVGRSAAAVPFGPGQSASSTLQLSGAGALKRLVLSVDLAHKAKGPLTVTLTSPSGKSAQVPVPQGKLVNATFDLSTAFAHEPAQGAWKLTVGGAGPSDAGKISEWSLDGVTP